MYYITDTVLCIVTEKTKSVFSRFVVYTFYSKFTTNQSLTLEKLTAKF